MVSPTKRWLFAITAVLAAATGCSTATEAPTPSAAGGDASASADTDSETDTNDEGACGSESGFCVTVDITGATTVQGTAQTLNLGTCADYAKGRSPGGALQLPGLLGEEVGGVINADGSGSFTFANLKEGEQGNSTTAKGTISGSFTWTCSD